MIGKLIVFAIDWKGAVKKAERALFEYIIKGVPTNLDLHKQIVKDPDFIAGNFHTGFLEKKLSGFNLEAQDQLKREEEKYQKLATLIASIQKNKVKVRQ